MRARCSISARRGRRLNRSAGSSDISLDGVELDPVHERVAVKDARPELPAELHGATLPAGSDDDVGASSEPTRGG